MPFWNANLDAAAGDLLAVIRELRPQVVVTYDEFGGYGHPDRVGPRSPCARSSWPRRKSPAKVYWTAIPRSVLEAGMRQFADNPFAGWNGWRTCRSAAQQTGGGRGVRRGEIGRRRPTPLRSRHRRGSTPGVELRLRCTKNQIGVEKEPRQTQPPPRRRERRAKDTPASLCSTVLEIPWAASLRFKSEISSLVVRRSSFESQI